LVDFVEHHGVFWSRSNLNYNFRITVTACAHRDGASGMTISKRTDNTLRNTLAALATLTQGIAELRGQLGTGHGANPEVERPPTEVARLAVGVATTLGVFLWDVHRSTAAIAVQPAALG
jgi:Abortive infection C-terminus